MVDTTEAEEARGALGALELQGDRWGTPSQKEALNHALEIGVRVKLIHHPTLGVLSFLVFQPVPTDLAETLDVLVQQTERFPYGPRTVYVTDNPNFPGPYWDLEF